MKIKKIDADYFIDITEDVCPMTFVKVRLQIEKMSPSETLEVRLKGVEPLKNVPDSVTELGHRLLSLTLESSGATADHADSVHRLVIEKNN
ncbi:MAG: sulfurtransferase TusA family protein [Alphaproteobacteria bacterium]|jgi:TusA-related sulfurtransferase|nr:sulfurtransferase TusA family protein [Alphaproteobacteria bacterium]